MHAVPPAQRTAQMAGYLRKWSGGKDKINFHQFRGALQSLSLPLHAAGEVFATFGCIGDAAVDVSDLSSLLMDGASTPASKGSSTPAKPPALPRNPGGAGPSGTTPPLSGSAVRAAAASVIGAGAPGASGVVASARSGTPQSVLSRSSRQQEPAGPRGATPVPAASSTQRLGSASSRSGGAAASAAARKKEEMNATGTLDFAGALVDRFRQAILHRGGVTGIHGISRLFRIMDDDGNRKLSPPELQTGLADVGMKLSLKDAQLLLSAMDTRGVGSVSFNDFLATLRGPMSMQRKKLIGMAFQVLDRSGDGVVRVDDIQASFNAKHYPDVMEGRLSEHDALEHFLAQFDGVHKDGCITRDEFMAYYENISASIDDDSYFELMIRNAWHIPGGTGQSANTANARVLVTMDDGSQCVVAIQNDLGLDLNDPVAVRAHLDAQGLHGAVGYEVAA